MFVTLNQVRTRASHHCQSGLRDLVELRSACIVSCLLMLLYVGHNWIFNYRYRRTIQ